jgi:hypothetical protein
VKNDVNVLSKSTGNKQRDFEKKQLIFCWQSCQPLTTAVESGSKSVSQWYGSADPDPYANVTDPQHSLKYRITDQNLGGRSLKDATGQDR